MLRFLFFTEISNLVILFNAYRKVSEMSFYFSIFWNFSEAPVETIQVSSMCIRLECFTFQLIQTYYIPALGLYSLVYLWLIYNQLVLILEQYSCTTE